MPLFFSYHTMATTKQQARTLENESPERLAAEKEIAQRAERIVAWTAEESATVQRVHSIPADRGGSFLAGSRLHTFRSEVWGQRADGTWPAFKWIERVVRRTTRRVQRDRLAARRVRTDRPRGTISAINRGGRR